MFDLRPSANDAGVTTDSAAGVPEAGAAGRRSHVRWVICALLFFATTINYVDRGVLGVLEPELQKKIGWTDTQYGDINAAFRPRMPSGSWWSGGSSTGWGRGSAMRSPSWSGRWRRRATRWRSTPMGFGIARFFLGLGEAGNFPSADQDHRRVVPPPRARRWLPASSTPARTSAPCWLPLIVPVLALTWGWQSAFVATGLLGLVWVVFWLPLYRPPRAAPAGLARRAGLDPERPARADDAASRGSQLLPHRQTWAFAAGKFLTDPIWWFYLFWSAKFLSDKFGVDLKHIGPPLIVIYLLADVGSVGGGWLSSWLLGRGGRPTPRGRPRC